MIVNLIEKSEKAISLFPVIDYVSVLPIYDFLCKGSLGWNWGVCIQAGESMHRGDCSLSGSQTQEDRCFDICMLYNGLHITDRQRKCRLERMFLLLLGAIPTTSLTPTLWSPSWSRSRTCATLLIANMFRRRRSVCKGVDASHSM